MITSSHTSSIIGQLKAIDLYKLIRSDAISQTGSISEEPI